MCKAVPTVRSARVPQPPNSRPLLRAPWICTKDCEEHQMFIAHLFNNYIMYYLIYNIFYIIFYILYHMYYIYTYMHHTIN